MISTLSISVREATLTDNILLAHLGAETFAQAFAAANTNEDMAAYLSAAFSPAIQAGELTDPDNIFWVVYVGEEVAGYVKFFTGQPAACISSHKALKISRFYLLNSWYGRGIGSELLQRSLRFAHQKELNILWLTVWEHNTRALDLYQKAGFKIVGEEDFILGQDVQRDFIMERVV